MSIASEITRIQNAKANIKESIENKGVIVPENTLIDGYADLIDEIQGGGGVLQPLYAVENGIYQPETGYDGFSVVSIAVPSGLSRINDLKFMFAEGARIESFTEIMRLANKNISDFKSFLESAKNVNFDIIDLSEFPQNLNLTYFARNAEGSGFLSLKDKIIESNGLIIGSESISDLNNYSNLILDLDGAKLTNNGQKMIGGSYYENTKNRDYYLNIRNLNGNEIDYTGEILLQYIKCDDDILNLSNLTYANSRNTSLNYSAVQYAIAKNVILPRYIDASVETILDKIYENLYNGLLTVENLTLPSNFEYSTSTSAITSAHLFENFQKDITDPEKMIEVDMEKYFPVAYLDRLAPTSNLFGDVNQYKISSGYGGPRGFINVHLTNNGQYVRPFGTSTTNVYNDVCRFNLKNGTTWASNTYTITCSLYLAYLWRGNASSIPDRDTEGKTTEEYFIEFLNSLGENTSGAVRNIRIYSGLYNTISQETKQIAIDKGYTLVSTSTY